MAGNPTLKVAHVFGMNPDAGLELADSNVLVSVCGNGLHFSSTNKSSRSVFLWGTGTGISAFAVCRRARLLAFAERGVSPRIYLHDLVTHELVCAHGDGAGLAAGAAAVRWCNALCAGRRRACPVGSAALQGSPLARFTPLLTGDSLTPAAGAPRSWPP